MSMELQTAGSNFSVGTDQIWLKNLGNCHEERSICASDYSRHEFQVLLSPMSTSFGPPMLNEKNSTCGQPSTSKNLWL